MKWFLVYDFTLNGSLESKADIFSYGMLLFEIISGKRNCDINDGTNDYFPCLTMVHPRNGGDVLSLLDYRLEGKANKEELTRICRVACWCLQDDENERPSMGHVILILEGVLQVTIPPISRFLERIAGYKEDDHEVSM
ncbi:Pkinase_Tyr domain-containing protein [Cephalotus follicularis]|uniref:Pkinase_Tyr domain-containing protein n=1 Tax=Cephalotus follicularis TaxID=3775 RepID=A0A1Q3BWF9_CEPFO|nr:Pkinase_Tyr domain-containing protein [Cephalotus follicularis]